MSQVKTAWDIDRYCDFLGHRQSGQGSQAEEELRKRFKPLFNELSFLDAPALITDKHGVALVWYLPGMLTKDRQTQLWTAVPVLDQHIKVTKGGNWRTGPKLYKPRDQCVRKPGSVSLSPAWFHQGYTVRLCIKMYMRFTLFIPRQMLGFWTYPFLLRKKLAILLWIGARRPNRFLNFLAGF